jgi:hypothetical protein
MAMGFPTSLYYPCLVMAMGFPTHEQQQQRLMERELATGSIVPQQRRHWKDLD